MSTKRAGGATPPGGAAAAGEGKSFEAMMARLDELVKKLEEGNLSLEDSIRSFEEGMTLVKQCTEVLQEAEQRIRKLTRDANGKPKTAPLEQEEPGDHGADDELPF